MLERGRARVHRVFPFTIRLVDRRDGERQNVAFKVDPGSKTTGVALVRQTKETAHVLSLIELEHRGARISENLHARSALRRRRRGANLRYRAPRFNNRSRKKGRLPPSLQHRVDGIRSWFTRLRKLAPVAEVVQELVRFDTQLMENPDVSGVEYQRGTLAGYEVREYVFEKLGRKCVYCDAKNVVLNLDHIQSKACGGSNRVSNLVPACIPCNERKSSQSLGEFLANDKPRAERIMKQAKAPLKDVAAVNTTRWALFHALSGTGIPLSVGTGGRTKYNRSRYGILKTHAFDAVCVGPMDTIQSVSGTEKPMLGITCMGRGAYQRTRLNVFGFPRGYLIREKRVKGFATGDMVRADVPTGKHRGVHVGRVAVRKSEWFNIQKPAGTVQGISWQHCRVTQRNDGYRYAIQPRLLPGLKAEVSGGGTI
jgi:5-methylcytosine-specific restriction endonuclease McrA